MGGVALEIIFLMSFFDTFDIHGEETSFQAFASTHHTFKPHAKFTAEDDEVLKRLVEEFGESNWAFIADRMPGRNARQVKERWAYYLSPRLNHSPWTQAEDNLLLEKQREMGSKWVRISRFFCNRTDAMVKNRFQVLKRREQKEKDLQARRERFFSVQSPAAASPAFVASEDEVLDGTVFDVLDTDDSLSMLGLDYQLVL